MSLQKTSKQIISVSRRTDIPAFYSEWFINRVRAGYCTVPNPFNANQVSRVSLAPSDVTAFVFWTRNPKPLMKYLPELDQMGFHYYFQYTIIGYPASIDPKSPTIDAAVSTFQELSNLIGKEKVIWRYDPILLSNVTPFEWHSERVSLLVEKLQGFTDTLVISFIDPYRKTIIRMEEETGEGFRLAPDAFEPHAYNGLAELISTRARTAGMRVQSCAEELDLGRFGITHGRCIDGELIADITGTAVSPRKDPSQRKQCGCVVSKDVGMNNTCLFGCKYCYATSSVAAALANHKKHDPASPSLIGRIDVPGTKEETKSLFSDESTI